MRNLIKSAHKLSFLFTAVFVLSLFAFSCKKDDNENVPAKNIVQVAASDPKFSILVEAIKKAGLEATLTGAGPFTVFAPTNAAFQAAGITDLNSLTGEQLRPILLYHVLPGKKTSTMLTSGESATASTGQSVNLTVNSTGVFVNGNTKVITANIDASNGVMHAIDKVLMPPSQTIVEIASSNSDFSLLVKAVVKANLVSTLSGAGPFTVFAPTNAAFEAAGFNEAAIASTPAADLAKVLTYHVVAGRVFSSDLSAGDVTTVQGGKVAIALSPTATVKGTKNSSASTIVATDILGTNGVIHVIDQVLLP